MSRTGPSPLVSVLMPAYQHERFVGAALDSVVAQGYAGWEAVVVDDGSSDATVPAVEARTATDPRIRLIRRAHAGPGGLAGTYRAALEASRGELIAILEADDTWPPGKLERQVADFDDPGVVLSFGDYAWIDETGAPMRRVDLAAALPAGALRNEPVGAAAWAMAGLAHRTFTFPCTVVLRRSALESAGGFTALGGPVALVDFPTFLEVALRGRFVYHREVLGSWRRHLGSMTIRHNESIAKAARDHAMDFLVRHPEVRPAGASDRAVEAAWDAAVAGALMTEARADLVARRWRAGSAKLRRLARGPAPAGLRALAVAGVAAAAARRDLEPLVRVARGHDLRPLAPR
jgi:glycosyltransferase involved in cell wall biosynthesis